jgi:two-component system, LuxR family, response regulator FixJ
MDRRMTRGHNRQETASGEEPSASLSGSRPEETLSGGGGRKILVVDDEADVADELVEALALAGFEAVMARSARQGLAMMATEGDIAAVVTDLKMPELDGRGLIAMIGSSAHACPVVVMTGHGGDQYRRELAQAGAHRVVLKPFDLDELLPILFDILDRRPGAG